MQGKDNSKTTNEDIMKLFTLFLLLTMSAIAQPKWQYWPTANEFYPDTADTFQSGNTEALSPCTFIVDIGAYDSLYVVTRIDTTGRFAAGLGVMPTDSIYTRLPFRTLHDDSLHTTGYYHWYGTLGRRIVEIAVETRENAPVWLRHAFGGAAAILPVRVKHGTYNR